MNKIYKVIWSKVKQCYVVVSEIARNTTKGRSKRAKQLALAAIVGIGVAMSSGVGVVYAEEYAKQEDLQAVEARVGANESAIITINDEISGINTAISSINTAAGDLESRVAANESAISTINGEISGINTAISSINTAAVDLESRVAANESAISTINGEISGINTAISEINTAAVDLESRVAANESAISTINGEISGINTAISSINTAAVDLESRVAANESAISTINGEISGINTAISSINTAAVDLESRVAANESAIGINTSAIATNASNIAANKSSIDANASAIVTLQSNAAALADRVDVNEVAIADNKTAIEANAGAIATNTGAIATNKTNIEANASAIEALQSDASSLADRVAANEGAIATNGENITALDAALESHKAASAIKTGTWEDGNYIAGFGVTTEEDAPKVVGTIGDNLTALDTNLNRVDVNTQFITSVAGTPGTPAIEPTEENPEGTPAVPGTFGTTTIDSNVNINGNHVNIGGENGINIEANGTSNTISGLSNNTWTVGNLESYRESTKAATEGQLYTVAKTGFVVQADDGTNTNIPLATELQIIGGRPANSPLSSIANLAPNVTTAIDVPNKTFKIVMTDDPRFNTVTVTNTVTPPASSGSGDASEEGGEGAGTTTTPAPITSTAILGTTLQNTNLGLHLNNGTDAPAQVSLTTAGLNNGGNRIINVAPGVADTDAVNMEQLRMKTVEVVGGANTHVSVTYNPDDKTRPGTIYTVSFDDHNDTYTSSDDGLITVSGTGNEHTLAFNYDPHYFGIANGGLSLLPTFTLAGVAELTLNGQTGTISGLTNTQWDFTKPASYYTEKDKETGIVPGTVAATQGQLQNVIDKGIMLAGNSGVTPTTNPLKIGDTLNIVANQVADYAYEQGSPSYNLSTTVDPSTKSVTINLSNTPRFNAVRADSYISTPEVRDLTINNLPTFNNKIGAVYGDTTASAMALANITAMDSAFGTSQKSASEAQLAQLAENLYNSDRYLTSADWAGDNSYILNLKQNNVDMLQVDFSRLLSPVTDYIIANPNVETIDGHGNRGAWQATKTIKREVAVTVIDPDTQEEKTVTEIRYDTERYENTTLAQENSSKLDGDNHVIKSGKTQSYTGTPAAAEISSSALTGKEYGKDYTIRDTAGNTLVIADIASATELKNAYGYLLNHENRIDTVEAGFQLIAGQSNASPQDGFVRPGDNLKITTNNGVENGNIVINYNPNGGEGTEEQKAKVDHLDISISENPYFTSVKAGGTNAAPAMVIDNLGLTFNSKRYIGTGGLSAADQRLQDVADGEVSPTSKDAINGKQFYQVEHALERGFTVTAGGSDGVHLQLKSDSEGNPYISSFGIVGSGNITTGVSGNNIAVGIRPDPSFQLVQVGAAANPIVINYNNENIITGLSNTSWTFGTNPGPNQGKAATEEQLWQLESILYGKGMNYQADGNGTIHRNLGDTLKIKGNATTVSTADNIAVLSDGADTFNIKLANNIVLDSTTNGSLTIGNAVVDKTGIKISNPDSDGSTNPLDMAFASTGISAGSKQIKNVASGINNTSYEAVADNNAANIGDVKALTTDVVATEYNLTEGETTYTGSNLVITPVENAADATGKKTFNVDLSNHIRLGTGDNVFKIDIDGNEGSIKIGDTTMNADGFSIKDGPVVAANGITNVPSGIGNTYTDPADKNVATIGDVRALTHIQKANENIDVTTVETKAEDGTTTRTTTVKLNDKIDLGTGSNQITVDGTAGTITLNGQSDAKATISTAKGPGNVGDAASTHKDRLIYKSSANVSEVVATMNDGMLYNGDNVTTSDYSKQLKVKLDEAVNIIGGGSTTAADLTDKNIAVVGDGNKTLKIQLAKDVDLTDAGSIKVGGTTIDSTKIDAGNKQINNVASGASSGAYTVGTNAANIQDVKNLTTVVNTAKWGSADTERNILLTEVNTNGQKTYTLDLSPHIKLSGDNKDLEINLDGTKGEITIGDTTINDEGLTIKDGPSVTVDGVDAGNKKIINVAGGTIGAGSTEVVNGGDVYNAISELSGKGWGLVADKGANAQISATIQKSIGETIAVKGDTNITTVATADGVEIQLNENITIGSGTNKINLNGQNGVATIGTADGKKVTIDGAQGTISTGAISLNGTAGTASAAIGAVAINGTTGSETITGLSNTTWSGTTDNASRAATEGQLAALSSTVAGKTFGITTQSGEVVKNLSNTITVKGSNDNLSTRKGTDDAVEIVLSDALNLTSVTTGNATLNTNGLTITNGPSVTSTGIDAGSKVITNVGSGLGNTYTEAGYNNAASIGDVKAAISTYQGSDTDYRLAQKAGGYDIVNGKVTLDVKDANGHGTDYTVEINDVAKASSLKAVSDNYVKSVIKDGQTLTIKQIVNGSEQTPDITFTNTNDKVVSGSAASGKLTLNRTDANNAAISAVEITGVVTSDQLAATTLSYKANSGTEKKVALSTGLNFMDGVNTTTEVGDGGIVKVNVSDDAINKAVIINGDTNVLANKNATTGQYSLSLSNNVTIGSGTNNINLNGENGVATIGATDGKKVTIDGAQGTISTGAISLNGTAGTASAAIGAVAINGTTGSETITGLSNTTWNGTTDNASRAATEGQLQALSSTVAGKTFGITTQSGEVVKNLSNTITVKGSNDNLSTRKGTDDAVEIVLSDALNLTSVTTGNATLNTNGLTITSGPSVTATGIDAGSKVITNVGSGLGNTYTEAGYNNAASIGDVKAAISTYQGSDTDYRLAQKAGGYDIVNGKVTLDVKDANGHGTDYTVEINDVAKASSLKAVSDNYVKSVIKDGQTLTIKRVVDGSEQTPDITFTNTNDKVVSGSAAGGKLTLNRTDANNAAISAVEITGVVTSDQLANGTNTTVETTADGKIKVNLNQDVTLGTSTNAITLKGSDGTATFGGGNNQVAINGTAGTISTGSVTLNGADGTAAIGSNVNLNGTAGTGNIGNIKFNQDTDKADVTQHASTITGLSNTDWDQTVEYKAGRAATEEQLKAAIGQATNKGLSFVGDDSNSIKKALGEELSITGGVTAAGDLSDDNIGVVNVDNGLLIKLAKNINVDSVTAAEALAVGSNVLLSKDGSAQLGKVNISAAGAISNDKASIGADGSASFADGKATIDADGKATFSNGTASTVIDGSNITAGKITVDGTAGTIGGLTNTSWDAKKYVSGQAATEDQLLAVATEAAKHSTVSAGANITVTPTTGANGTDYKVELDKDVTLGEGDKAVSLSGTEGTIALGTKLELSSDGSASFANGKATIDENGAASFANGKATIDENGAASFANGNVTIADTGATTFGSGTSTTTIDNSTITADKVTVNGAAGTITADKVTVNGTAGTIGGLTNTTWNADKVVKGQAATEDQLLAVVVEAGKKPSTSAGDNIEVNTSKNEDGSTNYIVSTKKDIKVDSINVGDNIALNKDGSTSFAGGKTTIDAAGTITNDKTKIDGSSVTTETVKTGNTTLDNTGMTIKDGPSLTDKGLSVGGVGISSEKDSDGNSKITGVADGEKANDAANIGQLAVVDEGSRERDAQLNQSISKLSSRVNKVGAHAAALAALHPLDFDPDEKLSISAGVGNYKGSSAGAIGAFYRPSEKVMFSLGGTVANKDNMINAGVTFALDATPNKTNSKTAMAKQILDLSAKVEVLSQQNAQMMDALRNANGNVNRIRVEFNDLPKGHWAYDYVQELAEKGFLEGYSDGSFKGDRLLTRYEFAAVVYRALQNGAPVDGNMGRTMDEFGKELDNIAKAARFRVDRVAGQDNDRNKVERVRTNSEAPDRDVYGSKISK